MATNTKNYNFKKPDESDFYDIQDQNGNWDIADEKMEELSAPTFEDYSGTTSVPEASTAIEAIKSKKKIPEILANIKAAFKGVCLLGHIVNNCVTDNAKLPLSAAQGKALMDQITKLNSDLEVEVNDLTDLLNPDYYNPAADHYLRIYRVGNVKILNIAIKAKALTGHDIIATNIPLKLRPTAVAYTVIQGRDVGGWASATYVPIVLNIGVNNITMSTGANVSKLTYISGTVAYI